MSGSDPENESKKNISVRVAEQKVDELDRAIKKAQIEGKLPMDYSRADALRHLIDSAIEDPDILVEESA